MIMMMIIDHDDDDDDDFDDNDNDDDAGDLQHPVQPGQLVPGARGVCEADVPPGQDALPPLPSRDPAPPGAGAHLPPPGPGHHQQGGAGSKWSVDSE